MAQQLKLQRLADGLEETVEMRQRIEAELKPIQEREDAQRADLIKELFRVGFDYVKTTSGKGFGIVRGKKTYTIVKGREQDAITWAQKEYPAVLSINKADLGKVLKPMLKIPDFFEEKIGEPHLQVRSADKGEEDI